MYQNTVMCLWFEGVVVLISIVNHSYHYYTISLSVGLKTGKARLHYVFPMALFTTKYQDKWCIHKKLVIFIHMYTVYVSGFWKTIPNCTFKVYKFEILYFIKAKAPCVHNSSQIYSCSGYFSGPTPGLKSSWFVCHFRWFLLCHKHL